jgi:hypothetical protein
MTDDPYVYPGTSILRNRLDLRHQTDLDVAERQLTRLRAAEGIPTGDFDLRVCPESFPYGNIALCRFSPTSRSRRDLKETAGFR